MGPRFFPGTSHPSSAPFMEALRRTGPQHGQLVPSLFLGSQRLRTIGQQQHVRPPTETFHDFLVFLVKSIASENWYRRELARPEAKRHELARWINNIEVRTASLHENPAHAAFGFDVPATGGDQCVLTLGYDLVHLLNQGSLPKELVRRLRKRDKFQGALYEIAVAGIFVRAGFEVRFIHDKTRKSPEFTARDPRTGIEVAVEAKSRHLEGVLDEPGPINMAKAMEGAVDHLIQAALQQSPRACPFLIFVDLNVPSTPTIPVQHRAWNRRFMASTYDRLGVFAKRHPEACSGVALTTFPFHWEGGGIATGTNNLMINFLGVKYPFPPDIFARVKRALDDYGEVPMEV